MRFLNDVPRFVFFTGKGGVGKTSLACATAVWLADQGKKVLLVSTDPASNVGHVFGQTVGNSLTDVVAAPGVTALEIDPHQAAEAYREKIIGPVRGLLPEKEIDSITEQLSGSCTTEVASFNEFTAYLGDDAASAGFDHVVFDTAPTGHTIRLLQLPGDWTSFLDEGLGDASCLGPMAGLDKTKATYAAALAALQDPSRTRLVLVARPQAAALAEVSRTASELRDIGLAQMHLVVNGVLPASVSADPLAEAIAGRERAALAGLADQVAQMPRDTIELKPETMMGVAALRGLLAESSATQAVVGDDAGGSEVAADMVDEHGVADLVAQLRGQTHGLIMCMGKGGVGKTTIAATLAIALADAGHDVHLTTTDPAAHLHETLAGHLPNIEVSHIDPHAATEAYRERVLATQGKNLDDAGRARLKEDLLSPCTEEIAVFQQFSHLVNQARKRFVVMDTAPTGHTLLLMDATGSYHRDVVRTMGEGTRFTTPLMRLQDPEHTKIVIVTLPDATPVLEAAALQEDLRRAQIEPWAWVVNCSLAAADPQDALLRYRAGAEVPHVLRVRELSERRALVAVQSEEPVGPGALRSLGGLSG